MTQSFPDLPALYEKLPDGKLGLSTHPVVVLNADGTPNTRDNPATVGSTVTLFATGVGLPVVAGTAFVLTDRSYSGNNSLFYDRYAPGYVSSARAIDGAIPGLAGLDLKIYYLPQAQMAFPSRRAPRF